MEVLAVSSNRRTVGSPTGVEEHRRTECQGADTDRTPSHAVDCLEATDVSQALRLRGAGLTFRRCTASPADSGEDAEGPLKMDADGVPDRALNDDSAIELLRRSRWPVLASLGSWADEGRRLERTDVAGW